MQAIRKIILPLSKEDIKSLNAGDELMLTGKMFTARDAAHKRLCELIDAGESLPVDLTDQTIYFAGPTPPRPGRPIGSIGPTTSSRMDNYSPKLIKIGLRAMIGKGYRNLQVREALKKFSAVHFSAIGGLGALLAKSIKNAKIVAYEDLGTEAVRELTVEDFPVIVAYDCYGNSIYPGDEPLI